MRVDCARIGAGVLSHETACIGPRTDPPDRRLYYPYPDSISGEGVLVYYLICYAVGCHEAGPQSQQRYMRLLHMLCFGSFGLGVLFGCMCFTLPNRSLVVNNVHESGPSWQAIMAQAKASRSFFVTSHDISAWFQHQQTAIGRKHIGSVNEIVFLVMASVTEKQRVASQRASWMRWAQHIVIFADAADAELGIITLPEIQNKSGFANAQWRQLYGMKWLLNHRPELAEKEWFFFVDDDTWVNVPVLCNYLSGFPSFLPLSFSHIYLMYNNQAVYNGGAGMLFSHAAFQIWRLRSSQANVHWTT